MPQIITEVIKLNSRHPALPPPAGIRRTQPQGGFENSVCEYIMAMTETLADLAKRDAQIPNYGAFIALYGGFYEPMPLPPRIRVQRLGRCFQNAQELVLRRPGLVYCEGFAICDFLPIYHGWATDAEGRVYDPTWATRAGPGRVIGKAYYGVPIQTEYVRTHRKRHYTQRCLSMIDDWVGRWPMLRMPASQFWATPADFLLP